MAAELSFRHTGTGKTMVATIRKDKPVGGKVQMWSTAGTPGWEDMLAAHWANYILTMTESEVGASYVYVGSWPATLTTAGWYVVDFYDGATIAGTLAGTFLGYWDGTTFGLGGADTRQIAGSAPAASNVASVFLGTGHTDDVDLTARNFHVFSDTDHAVRFESTCEGKHGLTTIGVMYGQYNYGGLIGQYNHGDTGYGQSNYCHTGYGQGNIGSEYGQYNYGNAGSGQHNEGHTAYGQYNYGPAGDIYLAGTGTVLNASGNVVQIGSAAALAAYNTTGVAKEASVGAIATILAGITSLAHWLRGLYNKRAMDSTAQTEIRDTTGTFDPTTDSNEAIRDSQLTQTQVSGGAYDLTNATYVAALKSGLGTVPASGNWNTVTPDAAGTAASIAVTIAGAGWSASTDTLEKIRDAVDGVSAGSGLTAQQTRDAMKLAPTTGTPAAGSVDAELDAIGLKTDQIGSANVTVTSPVAQLGEITIYIGNDYLLSEGRALTWVVTGVEVAFLDGATVTLRILRAPLFYRGHEPETLEADAEFEGDVVVANEEATITVELLAADTIELDALRTGYIYQLVAKTTDNTTHTIAAGMFTAVKAIQEPSA